MDLKDITIGMFSERPCRTCEFSRELVDVLSKADILPEQGSGFDDMSTELLDLDERVDGYYIDHYGVGFESKGEFLWKKPTDTVTVTEWLETDATDPGEWIILSWNDPVTRSTRMVGLTYDSHCHPYLTKII